jgi:hypothetical protein
VPEDPAPEWLPLDTAAARAGLNTGTLLQWTMAGRLPVRIVDGPTGPTHAIHIADLNALLHPSTTSEEWKVELRRLHGNLAAIRRGIGRDLLRDTSIAIRRGKMGSGPPPRPLPAPRRRSKPGQTAEATPPPEPAPRERYHWWYRLYRRVFG